MNNTSEKNINISYKSAGTFEETRFEKIHNEIFKNSTEANEILNKQTKKTIKKES